MSDAPATPGTEGTQTPAPATPEKQGNEGDNVTLSKAEVDQLRRDAARAAEAQSRLDRLIKKQSKPHFDPSRKPTPPSHEELEAQARAEDAKAEKGLIKLALDPEFRDVLDKDPTFRDLLTTEPLALLPIYANEALDADDAIEMVKNHLQQKAAALKTGAPKTEQKGEKGEKSETAPPSGGVNTQNVPTGQDQDYETAKKNPNTEAAIAGMIMAKVKQSGNK